MSNPFVKSDAQVREIGAKIKMLPCAYQVVAVDVETTPDFMAEITPPCFTPVEGKPILNISVGTFIGHSLAGQFNCTTIYATTSYKGQEGAFAPRMYTDDELANIIGREAWGEAKRYGTGVVAECGGKYIGNFSKNPNDKIIELLVEPEEDITPSEKEISYTFEVKATPDAMGNGFTHTPQIITGETVTEYKKLLTGNANIILRSIPGDELGEIPIVKVLGGAVVEAEATWRMIQIDEMENGDSYLPYYWGQKHCDHSSCQRILGFEHLEW